MTTTPAIPQDTPSPRKKGHGNAIITYELLADFSSKLTAVATRLEGVLDRLDDGARDHNDLEIRVRVLEGVQAGHVATAATSRHFTERTWSFVFSILSLGVSTGTLIMFILHAQH